MKLLILLCIVFIVSDRAIGSYARNLRRANKDKDRAEFEEYVEICLKLAEKDFEEISEDKPISTQKQVELIAKGISQCVFDQTGVTDSEGNFNPDAALKLVSTLGIEKDEAIQLLDKCMTSTRRNGRNAAWAIFNCMAQADPLEGVWFWQFPPNWMSREVF
ncbi:hypothetical protein B5X24_HaOG200796 [Helicoverpa armigera]|uniref:Uncharacterized protein n=1 Tax=Helicoverpa armigera TaxID=29058 RepID=A0A2W1BNP8_HELAM|nr:hypothetical protein B5X24_HaOG200796 [Helicoverpa armigera]